MLHQITPSQGTATAAWPVIQNNRAGCSKPKGCGRIATTVLDATCPNAIRMCCMRRSTTIGSEFTRGTHSETSKSEQRKAANQSDGKLSPLLSSSVLSDEEVARRLALAVAYSLTIGIRPEDLSDQLVSIGSRTVRTSAAGFKGCPNQRDGGEASLQCRLPNAGETTSR